MIDLQLIHEMIVHHAVLHIQPLLLLQAIFRRLLTHLKKLAMDNSQFFQTVYWQSPMQFEYGKPVMVKHPYHLVTLHPRQ